MNLLQKATEWLGGKRVAYASTVITYCRGESAIEINATVGKTVFRLDRDYGVTERVESRDYLIQVEDLEIDGVRTMPRAGDQIKEGGNIYEVMAPGGEPHYRFSDPYRKAYRIHTKHIGTEGD